MSQDDLYEDDNPYAYRDSSDAEADRPTDRTRRAEQSSSPGMSTGLKIVLGVAVVAGVLMLLCCGGLFWGFRGVAENLKNAMTTDPVEIAEIEKTIADITPPEGIEPQMAFNIGMFGFGMKMVLYSDQEIDIDPEAAQGAAAGKPPKVPTGEGTSILLMSMNGPEMSDVDVEQQFSSNGDDNFEVESTETKTLTVGGEERDFVFAKGKNTDNDTPYRQVTGMFTGREGPAFIIISIPEEDWNEDEVVRTIESLKVD